MPDSQPNYLSVDAQGKVGAVFTGGVKLPLSATPTVGTENAIIWVRQSDGAYVAYDWTYSDGETTRTDIGLNGTGDAAHLDKTAVIGISAYNRPYGVPNQGVSGTEPNMGVASLGLFTLGRFASVSANAVGQAGSQSKLVIDSNGESDFLQVHPNFSPAKTALVPATGNTPPTPVGGFFTVTVAHGLSWTPTGGHVMAMPGGGLLGSVTPIAFLGADAVNVSWQFQNNAGFALTASTIRLLQLLADM